MRAWGMRGACMGNTAPEHWKNESAINRKSLKFYVNDGVGDMLLQTWPWTFEKPAGLSDSSPLHTHNHQRGGPLPEHIADTRPRRSFLAKSPYVTISSRLFVQASFATTAHSLQNLNIKARSLPSSFGPHWRRTWSFVKFVLPEVFQASLWAFPWSYFCFRCPTISSSVATRGIHPPLHTSMEFTEACIF